MGSSRCFSLVGVYRGMLRFGALGLVLIIAPSFELGIAHRFFFMDSLLFQKHSIKFSRFFATGSTSWHPFKPVQPVHRVSRCKTLIFGNYFDHISLFRTRNCVPLFLWIPHSSRNILSNFQNFLQPVRPVGIQFDRLASGSAGSIGSSSQLV